MLTRVLARALVAVVVAVLGAAGVGLVAAPALAHNVLRSTAPVAGAEVDVPPADVTLVFDQPAIALGNVVEVTGPDGEVVSEGDPELVDTTVRQPISSVLAGEYRVVWRVSSSDGHPIEGEFGFTVAAGAPTTSASDPPSSSPSSSAGEVPDPGPTTVAQDQTADESSDPASDGPWFWVLGLAAAAAVGAVAWFLLRRNGRRGGAVP